MDWGNLIGWGAAIVAGGGGGDGGDKRRQVRGERRATARAKRAARRQARVFRKLFRKLGRQLRGGAKDVYSGARPLLTRTSSQMAGILRSERAVSFARGSLWGLALLGIPWLIDLGVGQWERRLKLESETTRRFQQRVMAGIRERQRKEAIAERAAEEEREMWVERQLAQEQLAGAAAKVSRNGAARAIEIEEVAASRVPKLRERELLELEAREKMRAAQRGVAISAAQEKAAQQAGIPTTRSGALGTMISAAAQWAPLLAAGALAGRGRGAAVGGIRIAAPPASASPARLWAPVFQAQAGLLRFQQQELAGRLQPAAAVATARERCASRPAPRSICQEGFFREFRNDVQVSVWREGACEG